MIKMQSICLGTQQKLPTHAIHGHKCELYNRMYVSVRSRHRPVVLKQAKVKTFLQVLIQIS